MAAAAAAGWMLESHSKPKKHNIELNVTQVQFFYIQHMINPSEMRIPPLIKDITIGPSCIKSILE